MINISLNDASCVEVLTEFMATIYDERGLYDSYRNGPDGLITTRYTYYNNLDYNEETKNREALVSVLLLRENEQSEDMYIDKPFLQDVVSLQESVVWVLKQAHLLLTSHFFDGYDEACPKDEYMATPYLKIIKSEEEEAWFVVAYYLYKEKENN